MTKARTGALVLALTIVAILAASVGRWRSHLYMFGHPDASIVSEDLPPAHRRSEASAHVPPATASKPRAEDADRGPEPPSAPNPDYTTADASASPHFDVVRVEPSGGAVVAGKARPNSTVELVDGGHVVGKTTADDTGSFVLLPAPLKPGSYDFSLRTQAVGKPPATSKQSVAVSVPPTKTGEVVVALAEPGRPSEILSKPSRSTSHAPAASANTAASKPNTAAQKASAQPHGTAQSPGEDQSSPKAASSVWPAPRDGTPAQEKTSPAIQSVELENRSGVHVSGEAKPGARTEVYLNDSHLASVTPNAEGHWSVTVRKGLTGGHYAVRADTLGGRGQVAARVEVPFDVPKSAGEPDKDQAKSKAAEEGRAGSTPADASVPTKPSAGDAIVDAVETALVVRGDNLWDISRTRLGAGQRYTRIYASNVSQIRDPKLIYPGQVFVVPGD